MTHDAPSLAMSRTFAAATAADAALQQSVTTVTSKSSDSASVTVARMEVPCCGGTVAIVEKALELAGKEKKLKVNIVGIDGCMQTE